VKKYVSSIVRYNYLPSYAVDDIVANAFESCYRKRSEFHGKSKFSTWACKFDRYIIIRHQNRCLWIAYKSLKVEYQILIDWKILGEITATEAKHLTGLNKSERKHYLNAAIKILRKRYLALYNNYW